MKQVITMLLFCLLFSTSSLTAASGSITGTVYLPNTERGMRIAKSDAGAGVMWDMSAPSNRKRSERAEVWLIERSINLKALPYTTVQKWYQEKLIPAKQPIFHATADEKGQFALENIPAADYYLVILDPNGKETTQNLSDKISRDELLEKLPHPDEFELFMVGMRACLVQKITLHDGQKMTIRPGIL